MVVGERVQIDVRPKVPEVVELTAPTASTRPGGRFWVFLESEDEEQVEVQVPTRTLVASQGARVLPEPNATTLRRRSKVQNFQTADETMDRTNS